MAAVSWLGPIDDVRAWLVRRHGATPVDRGDLADNDPRRRLLDRTVRALERWMAGEREPFDLPLDLTGRRPGIARFSTASGASRGGATESYGGVARMIGRAGAARAVGGAVGRNPIGVIIPCHRVIAGDGTLGGYGGDAWGSHRERQELKRALLRVEGVAAAISTD